MKRIQLTHKIEGNIHVGHVPYVTIADTPLKDCSYPVIQKELLGLIKTLEEKRERILELEAENKQLRAERDSWADAAQDE